MTGVGEGEIPATIQIPTPIASGAAFIIKWDMKLTEVGTLTDHVSSLLSVGPESCNTLGPLRETVYSVYCV